MTSSQTHYRFTNCLLPSVGEKLNSHHGVFISNVDAIKVLIITGNNMIKVIQISEGIKTLF